MVKVERGPEKALWPDGPKLVTLIDSTLKHDKEGRAFLRVTFADENAPSTVWPTIPANLSPHWFENLFVDFLLASGRAIIDEMDEKSVKVAKLLREDPTDPTDISIEALNQNIVDCKVIAVIGTEPDFRDKTKTRNCITGFQVAVDADGVALQQPVINEFVPSTPPKGEIAGIPNDEDEDLDQF